MPPARSLIFPAAVAALLSCYAAPAAACTLTTAPVAFGIYDPRSGTAHNGAGSITMVCPNGGVNNTQVLSLSAGGAGGFAPRQMASGANRLNYNLYTTAARATVWGNGTAGTSTVNVAGRNRTTVTNVYGQMPALQNVPAGSYTDTIVVTVTF